MSARDFSDEFWRSAANHVAVDPARREDAEGLTAFAERNGWEGMCFFQTSGSEGLPKWVGLTKEAFLISGRAVNEHFEVTRDDRWLVALPLHHVGGFAIYARALLAGTVVVGWQAPKWDPRAFVRSCEEERISLVSLVPAQVHDLVRQRLGCPPDLRAAIIGGGGMTQALADQAVALGWRVFQSYGMTESASQIATQPYNPFGAVFDVTSLEILPHWQAEVDDEKRLVLKGAALAQGYAQRLRTGEWSWQEIIPAEGLGTRDVVRLWQHGTRRFLSFVGRESGYVKILGELVHLAPLQARLEELALATGWPDVPLVAAVPDARRESALVLVKESGCPKDGEALRLAFNAETRPLCHLTRVVEVTEIPRTALRKVDSGALARVLSAAENHS